jgi:hypothetical protein
LDRRKTAVMPAYIDGCFTVCDVVDGTPDPAAPDFSPRVLRPRELGPVWFRELAVYDRTRATLQQADAEITRKVAIPRWEDIGALTVVMIGGEQHRVYNAAQVISRQGFPETELTLVRPEQVFPLESGE